MTISVETQVAKTLLQINAIKLSPQNPFTWASGKKSPIYCDNRIVLSYPEARNFIKQCLIDKSSVFGEFDAVSGVATAGIAHGAFLADALGKPFSYIRSKPKGHGRQNTIEGELKGTERVLVVEDLISTGGSSLKAVEDVRALGCEVVGVIAIFSYGFDKAVTAFKAADCPFATLSNYEALIEEAAQSGYVKKEEIEMLKAWRSEF